MRTKDEIAEFQEARFVSASEACHRIYQFKTHDQYPHTQRLPVHLENNQTITFNQNDNLPEILEKNHETNKKSLIVKCFVI